MVSITLPFSLHCFFCGVFFPSRYHFIFIHYHIMDVFNKFNAFLMQRLACSLKTNFKYMISMCSLLLADRACLCTGCEIDLQAYGLMYNATSLRAKIWEVSWNFYLVLLSGNITHYTSLYNSSAFRGLTL